MVQTKQSFRIKGCSVLYSYETPVALIVGSGNRAYKTDRKWSVTTSKHINQWLRAEGFDPKEDVTLVPQDVIRANGKQASLYDDGAQNQVHFRFNKLNRAQWWQI